MPAVVSMSAALIDAVAARLNEPGVELIVDADEGARAAALAVALASGAAPLALSDVASDQKRGSPSPIERRGQPHRVDPGATFVWPGGSRTVEPGPATDAPEVSIEQIRSVIRARRLRGRYFSDELFADPAWDMLLDLLQAEIAQLRVPVSSLCIAAAVPATTALRWLKSMTDEGIFVRRADPHDGRRVFVELSPQASGAMRRYFAEVGKVAVI